MKLFIKGLVIDGKHMKARINEDPDVRWVRTTNPNEPSLASANKKVDCAICKRYYGSKEKLKTHWHQYHMSRISLIQRKSFGCPVAGCSFSKKGTKLQEHLEVTHSCTTLLEAGVDVYKVRRNKLSDYAKAEILTWLKKKRFVIVRRKIPILPKPKDEIGDEV